MLVGLLVVVRQIFLVVRTQHDNTYKPMKKLFLVQMQPTMLVGLLVVVRQIFLVVRTQHDNTYKPMKKLFYIKINIGEKYEKTKYY